MIAHPEGGQSLVRHPGTTTKATVDHGRGCAPRLGDPLCRRRRRRAHAGTCSKQVVRKDRRGQISGQGRVRWRRRLQPAHRDRAGESERGKFEVWFWVFGYTVLSSLPSARHEPLETRPHGWVSTISLDLLEITVQGFPFSWVCHPQ